MSDIIKIDGITKKYGDKTVFDNFSCQFQKGKTTFVFGPSGCGKTTLFRMLSGLDKPDSGYISGNDSVSYMMQEDFFAEEYTASANIRLFHGGVDKLEAEEILDRLGLKNERKTIVSRLSGGMRRRVSLARLLLSDSNIYLLDEPFDGLDTQTKITASNAIKQILDNKTVLIITHDINDAALFDAEVVQIL